MQRQDEGFLASVLTDQPRPEGVQSRRPRPLAHPLHIMGELALTAAAVVALFLGYQIWAVPSQTHHQQRLFDRELSRTWDREPPATEGDGPEAAGEDLPSANEGEPLVRLHAPSLGESWIVVEGVALDDLKQAPGHYPDSQLPGEPGNFAVAGHRRLGLFWDLDKLKAGDPLVVETPRRWLTYTVYDSQIVDPTETGVIAANPDHPGRAPERTLITLTTCSPKWDTTHRLVVHAELARISRQRPAGFPS